jgi:hypothetical protein
LIRYETRLVSRIAGRNFGTVLVAFMVVKAVIVRNVKMAVVIITVLVLVNYLVIMFVTVVNGCYCCYYGWYGYYNYKFKELVCNNCYKLGII